MTLKQKALAHYDRMIEWAEKQPKKMHVYRDVMYMAICEDFSGHYCAYCQNNESIACDECKLLSDDGCCGGLYRIMDKAQTWSTWVKRARKVREYIEKHG